MVAALEEVTHVTGNLDSPALSAVLNNVPKALKAIGGIENNRDALGDAQHVVSKIAHLTQIKLEQIKRAIEDGDPGSAMTATETLHAFLTKQKDKLTTALDFLESKISEEPQTFAMERAGITMQEFCGEMEALQRKLLSNLFDTPAEKAKRWQDELFTDKFRETLHFINTHTEGKPILRAFGDHVSSVAAVISTELQVLAHQNEHADLSADDASWKTLRKYMQNGADRLRVLFAETEERYEQAFAPKFREEAIQAREAIREFQSQLRSKVAELDSSMEHSR